MPLPNKKFYSIFLVFGLILVTSACKKNNVTSNSKKGNDSSVEALSFDSSLPSGQMIFSQLPVDTSNIGYIIALGHLNPPDHTIPTDHMYFVDVPVGTVIYAPATGKVFLTFYEWKSIINVWNKTIRVANVV